MPFRIFCKLEMSKYLTDFGVQLAAAVAAAFVLWLLGAFRWFGRVLRQRRQRRLADEEKELLAHAADTGQIMVLSSDRRGVFLQAGARQFVNTSDRSLASRYVDALGKLESRLFVRKQSDTLYLLTTEGFAVARRIPIEAAWLLVEPIIMHTSRDGEPHRKILSLFLRNAGSIKPRTLRVTLRFPRAYALPFQTRQATAETSEHKRFIRDESANQSDLLDQLLPGIAPTIALSVEYVLDKSVAAAGHELIEILVDCSPAKPYLARFSIEQLHNLETARQYIANRAQNSELSTLTQL